MGDDNGGQKRRRFDNAKQQFGGRNKKKELGRGSYNRQPRDKRTKIDEEQTAKRQKLSDGGDDNTPSFLPKPFSQEEIDAEERKPKYKVAVLIGYSGTGYKGMQINTTERTIEGDLFTAFVKAGAISKANANDPKKSALVRCARTDKGVHAAGNVVSLKLIIEDSKTVENINSHLSSQIRVWGIQRTVGSFSCYQSCDSRWYEYLIPSHSFLPPNPTSFLARKIIEHAEEMGEIERAALNERQKEVSAWWAETLISHIQPIVDELEEGPLKELVKKAVFDFDEEEQQEAATTAVITEKISEGKVDITLPDAPILSNVSQDADKREAPEVHTRTKDETSKPTEATPNQPASQPPTLNASSALDPPLRKQFDLITRRLRAAYIKAKGSYRIPTTRLDRIQAALDAFVGSHNFHNYTVDKSPGDPSARRLIKSFQLDRESKLINGTEWLSIKIHGQSFMMHQIRKMISAVALIVRCGCPISRVGESLSESAAVSVPKVPGLGLLLERPVFDSYNENTATKYERDPIDFGKYEDAMKAFKQTEIYERIFREEEEQQQFHTFFGHVDSFREPAFLWVTSKGVQATKGGRMFKEDGNKGGKRPASRRSMTGVDSEDEIDVNERGRKDMDG